MKRENNGEGGTIDEFIRILFQSWPDAGGGGGCHICNQSTHISTIIGGREVRGGKGKMAVKLSLTTVEGPFISNLRGEEKRKRKRKAVASDLFPQS